MRVFVINMKKDVRRRTDMANQLGDLKVNYEFFEGVDGKKISSEEIQKISDENKLVASKKKPFNELKGLIGCTYSHYLIYQKMVEDQIDHACILEDDVILSTEFKKQLDWLEQETKENEIVSLHTLLYDPVKFKETDRINNQCKIVEPLPPKIRGTQGYVISKYCAKQLMAEMMPIKEFPDCFNRYQLFCPDVKIRVLFPFIIRHMWIDSVRDDKLNGLKDRTFNFIQKHRIFPFWNFIRTRRRKINDSYISSFITLNEGAIYQMYISDLQPNLFLSQL